MKVISGMHRSGTSLMARLCHEAGADMGDPNTFYEGDKWNPDGYFEQVDIHEVNMPLVNGMWGKLSYFKLPSTPTIVKRSDRYAPKIKEYAKKYENAVVKETRFCLTIPGWEKHGTKFQKVLACLRSPIQVAGSIKKRNKTVIRHGLELWYTHNQRLLENTKNTPVHWVAYNRLLHEETSFEELKKAFQFMEIEVSDQRINELKGEFIKTNMNHNPDKPFNYPTRIEKLYKDICEIHAKQ